MDNAAYHIRIPKTSTAFELVQIDSVLHLSIVPCHVNNIICVTFMYTYIVSYQSGIKCGVSSQRTFAIFFRLTTRNPVFRDKKCHILTFRDKTVLNNVNAY